MPFCSHTCIYCSPHKPSCVNGCVLLLQVQVKERIQTRHWAGVFVRLSANEQFLILSFLAHQLFCCSVHFSFQLSSVGLYWQWPFCLFVSYKTLHIILKAPRLNIVCVIKKTLLFLAFIQFGQSSTESLWHGSAPLCIVRHCSEVAILRGRRLILVWDGACALCRAASSQMRKSNRLMREITKSKTVMWCFIYMSHIAVFH